MVVIQKHPDDDWIGIGEISPLIRFIGISLILFFGLVNLKKSLTFKITLLHSWFFLKLKYGTNSTLPRTASIYWDREAVVTLRLHPLLVRSTWANSYLWVILLGHLATSRYYWKGNKPFVLALHEIPLAWRYPFNEVLDGGGVRYCEPSCHVTLHPLCLILKWTTLKLFYWQIEFFYS